MIRRPLILWRADRHGDKPYAASIIYRRDDPYAVTIALPLRPDDIDTAIDDLRVADSGGDSISVLISFARELLIDGCEAPCGEGTVRVEPHILDLAYVTITLPVTVDGVEFYTDRPPLESFTDATLQMVPSGGEPALVDQDLNRWLAGVLA